MADRVIQRNDTAARWQSINPVLAQGEMGIVSDGAKGYKIGDGVTAWNNLEYPANPASVVQETGNSETAVMSQKSVSNMSGIINIPVFDSTYHYKFGDIVQYGGKIYEFIKTYSGEWNSSYVRESSLRNESSSLMFNGSNLISDYPIKYGYYNEIGEFIENENFIAIDGLVPITGNSKYLYRGAMFSALALPIYNSNGSVIGAIKSSEGTISVKEFIAPNNARYIKISSFLGKGTLPIGFFEVKTLSNDDEIRVSNFAGIKAMDTFVTEQGTGYYNVVNNNLEYVNNLNYKYYKYKNIPSTYYSLHNSGAWKTDCPMILKAEGIYRSYVVDITKNELMNFGAYDELIFQVSSDSNLYINPSIVRFEKSQYSGGFTNIIKTSEISNGFFYTENNKDIISSIGRTDLVKTRVLLEAGKSYILSGNTFGTAACFTTFTDNAEILQKFTLSQKPVLVETGIYDLHLYYCSVVNGVGGFDSSVIGVYEIPESNTFNSLFYFRSNKDNFSIGWYHLNTLKFTSQTRDETKLTPYCHSIPISVTPGQKLRYYGAGHKNMAAILSCDSNGVPDGVFRVSTETEQHSLYRTIDFIVPKDVLYIIMQSRIDTTDNALAVGGVYIKEAYLLNLGTVDAYINYDVKWTIPDKIYAIKGQEKSIYFDNIVNRNEDAPNYVIEVSNNFGQVDSRRFYFTPDSIGVKSIILNAWDSNNTLISSRTVSIEVIDNTLSSSKRVVCIGDSITEGTSEGDTGTNMPYHIKKGLDSSISGSTNIIFVGSKGSPVKHEGWWGRSYQWLAEGEGSPLINPETNKLDIHYYRTKKCGLGEVEYIDVVSLAMGFNGTSTKSDGDNAFISMQNIIAAFKNDNPNTKFIIHLVTYPAMGNVEQPIGEEKINKKNLLYYFRQLCINSYNNKQDSNIFIGDLGLGYDRWYAYNRTTVHPASYYDTDNIQVVTDRVHPSYKGARQMGENIMHCILKAMQM